MVAVLTAFMQEILASNVGGASTQMRFARNRSGLQRVTSTILEVRMRGLDAVDGRSYSKVLGALALAGAVALIALPAIRRWNRRWTIRHPDAQKEPAIDKSLQDTYPASDPPASRYFDIPVNRR